MSTLKVNNLQDLGADAVVTNGVVNASALPGGSILQVVSTTKTDSFSTTSTSLVDVTGFAATITPRSTSSKILVLCDIYYSNSNSGANQNFNLVRNSTTIAQGTGGTSQFTMPTYTASGSVRDFGGFNFLDTPATTSTTTYKIQMSVSGATGYVNRGGDLDRTGISSITLMEVAG
jgi:hypothetical protein